MRTLSGHFDGRVIVLDEPAGLAPNTKVKVLAPSPEEMRRDLTSDFARASEAAFKRIWDNSLDAEYDKL